MLLYIRIWFSTLFHPNMLISLSAKEIMSGCATLFLAFSGRCSEVSSFSRLPSHLHELDSGSFSILLLPYFIQEWRPFLSPQTYNHSYFPISHPISTLSFNRKNLFLLCLPIPHLLFWTQELKKYFSTLALAVGIQTY